MKKWLVAVGLVAGLAAKPNDSKAQTTWNHGQLVLNNSTILEGELNYNWVADVLQLKQSETTRAYSAQMIEAFTFFDRQSSVLRRFVRVDYPVKPTQTRPTVVEEIATGPCRIYRRLHKHRDLIRLGVPGLLVNETTNAKDVDDFDYIIYTNNGFMLFDQFRRELMPQMLAEFKPQLTEYLRTHQLDPNTTTTQLMLLIRYNNLKEDQDKTAPMARREAIGAGED